MKKQDEVYNKTSGSLRVLTIEKGIVRFRYLKDNLLQHEIILKAGYQTIVSNYFKNIIPTEAETEYAINFIEDELMSKKELVNKNETLVSPDNDLAAILNKNGLEKGIYSRQKIEDLFSDYARIVKGTPSSVMNIDITREDFAIVLLLREIVHHLNFETIDIQASKIT